MKSTFSEGTLCINLAGRIDTANAVTIDGEIAETIASQKGGVEALVLDCAELQYISSTGLRVILKYKKQYANLKVINVCNDVYSIFESTGFVRIMTIQKAMRKIDISQCSLLAQGGNGAVYRINQEEIVKVQHLVETEQMLLDEMGRSKAAFILGVPTAISYDIVDCGEGRLGAVYEALNSDTLGRYVHSHPEHLQECAVKYADLLKTLHSSDATDTEFVSIKQGYLNYYKDAHLYYTPEEIATLHEILDMIPERNTLVHADAHTNNILMGTDGELMFIDMADTDMGHPVFDYAGISLAMIMPMASGRSLGICGMDQNEIPQFLTIAFTRMLALTDPEDIKQLIPRLVNMAYVKYSMVICQNNKSVNEIRPILLDVLRKNLFGNKEQVKNDIQWFIDRV